MRMLFASYGLGYEDRETSGLDFYPDYSWWWKNGVKIAGLRTVY